MKPKNKARQNSTLSSSRRIVPGQQRRITISKSSAALAQAEIAAIQRGFVSLSAFLHDQIDALISSAKPDIQA